MTRRRLRTQADRQILARIGGQRWKRVSWGELPPDEMAAAANKTTAMCIDSQKIFEIGLHALPGPVDLDIERQAREEPM
jgi:hypothetical protein